MARPVILTPSGLPRLDDVLAAACFYATASSVSRGVFGCGVVDDPAIADETASLRDRNDIAKRGHPVLQGSLTAVIRLQPMSGGLRRTSIASSPSSIKRLTARAKYAASAAGCGPAKLSASSSAPAQRYCTACAMTCSAVPASAKP